MTLQFTGTCTHTHTHTHARAHTHTTLHYSACTFIFYPVTDTFTVISVHCTCCSIECYYLQTCPWILLIMLWVVFQCTISCISFVLLLHYVLNVETHWYSWLYLLTEDVHNLFGTLSRLFCVLCSQHSISKPNRHYVPQHFACSEHSVICNCEILVNI